MRQESHSFFIQDPKDLSFLFYPQFSKPAPAKVQASCCPGSVCSSGLSLAWSRLSSRCCFARASPASREGCPALLSVSHSPHLFSASLCSPSESLSATLHMAKAPLLVFVRCIQPLFAVTSPPLPSHWAQLGP